MKILLVFLLVVLVEPSFAQNHNHVEHGKPVAATNIPVQPLVARAARLRDELKYNRQPAIN